MYLSRSDPWRTSDKAIFEYESCNQGEYDIYALFQVAEGVLKRVEVGTVFLLIVEDEFVAFRT